MIFKKLAEYKLGMHSINTIIYYQEMIRKYNAVRMTGLEHWEACEQIGISDNHYYLIKRVVDKVEEILNSEK